MKTKDLIKLFTGKELTDEQLLQIRLSLFVDNDWSIDLIEQRRQRVEWIAGKSFFDVAKSRIQEDVILKAIYVMDLWDLLKPIKLTYNSITLFAEKIGIKRLNVWYYLNSYQKPINYSEIEAAYMLLGEYISEKIKENEG